MPSCGQAEHYACRARRGSKGRGRARRQGDRAAAWPGAEPGGKRPAGAWLPGAIDPSCDPSRATNCDIGTDNGRVGVRGGGELASVAGCGIPAGLPAALPIVISLLGG